LRLSFLAIGRPIGLKDFRIYQSIHCDAVEPTGSRFVIAVHAVQMSRNREIRQTPPAQVSEIERPSPKYGVKIFSRLEPFA
jgi:hypothetical protein